MSEFSSVFDDLNLSVIPRFIPWSHSRSAKPSPKLADYNLNWHVTLLRADRLVFETDYSQGQGFCPSYSQREAARPSVHYAELIRSECETGRRADITRKPIAAPSGREILDSLMMDANVLDYPTYEQWAADTGFDSDSRKGEAIYRACLEIALKLRAAIGEDGLTRLRNALRADEEAEQTQNQ